jgi:hypothetical protein
MSDSKGGEQHKRMGNPTLTLKLSSSGQVQGKALSYSRSINKMKKLLYKKKAVEATKQKEEYKWKKPKPEEQEGQVDNSKKARYGIKGMNCLPVKRNTGASI